MNKKVFKSIELIKRSEELAFKYSDNGFHLSFSGGKDSQVIYELCLMAGVKFKSFFYKTSVDPPELLKFIKNSYQEVNWLKPNLTMFQLILKKGMLPLRQSRFCCEFLKEKNGLNTVVITGLRKAESVKRNKRKEFELSCIKGNDKILLNPIINWTDHEVYSFLEKRSIPLCELYKINNRIGCVGCPMSPKSMRNDFIRLPNYKLAYINTVNKLISKGKYLDFNDAEDVINWWSSGKSKAIYLAEKKQLSIPFSF